MKKILLVVSLISVLLLAGCNKNEIGENNNIQESAGNQHQDVVDNNENSMDNLQEDIEKYRLSDKYEIDDYAINGYFNVCNTNYEYKFVLDEPMRFSSNGKEYNIIAKEIESEENGEHFIKLYINDNEINTVSDIYAVGVIDIDVTDGFKEIVIREQYGDISIKTFIYRINEKGELVEVNTGDINLSSLCYLNNKYIFPVYLFGGVDIMSCGPVVGYYTYENGELVYVDRLLTGEKAIDENGRLVIEDIYEFSDDIGLNIHKSESDRLVAQTEPDDSDRKLGKFKILSFKVVNEVNPLGEPSVALLYDIELLDDAEWTRSEFSEIDGYYHDVILNEVKKGTVIKNVSISISEP